MVKNILIVLNYNSSNKVIELVEKVESYEHVDSVIIVDNCSAESDYNNLVEHMDLKAKAVLLRTSKNDGYAAGNNFGMQYAIKTYGEDIVLFVVNPDVLFGDSAIDSVSEFILSHDDAGMVAPMEKNGKNAWKFTTLFRNIFFESGFGSIIFRKKCQQMKFYPKDDFRETKSVNVILGAFFGISAKAMELVGFFDENTFLYFEEEILARKLKCNGYSNYIIGKETYEHRHNYSNEKNNLKKAQIMNDSRNYLFRAYGHVSLFGKILLRFSNFDNDCVGVFHNINWKIKKLFSKFK